MYLIRAGRRIINLNYLIIAEEFDGVVRVTMAEGKEFDVTGDEARSFWTNASPAVVRDATETTVAHASMALRVGGGPPEEPHRREHLG